MRFHYPSANFIFRAFCGACAAVKLLCRSRFLGMCAYLHSTRAKARQFKLHQCARPPLPSLFVPRHAQPPPPPPPPSQLCKSVLQLQMQPCCALQQPARTHTLLPLAPSAACVVEPAHMDAVRSAGTAGCATSSSPPPACAWHTWRGRQRKSIRERMMQCSVGEGGLTGRSRARAGLCGPACLASCSHVQPLGLSMTTDTPCADNGIGLL